MHRLRNDQDGGRRRADGGCSALPAAPSARVCRPCAVGEDDLVDGWALDLAGEGAVRLVAGGVPDLEILGYLGGVECGDRYWVGFNLMVENARLQAWISGSSASEPSVSRAFATSWYEAIRDSTDTSVSMPSATKTPATRSGNAVQI